MRLSVYLLLFLVMVTSVVADASWLQPSYDSSHSSRQNPVYTADFANGITTISSSALGYNNDPLIYDIDNDNSSEIIISSGSLIYLYGMTPSGAIYQKAAYNVGSSVYPFVLAEIDFDPEIELIIPNTAYISVVDYSNNTWTLESTYTVGNSSEWITTGIACDGFYFPRCYFGMGSSTNRIGRLNTGNATVDFYTFAAGAPQARLITTYSRRTTPTIDDSDYDGKDEIIFVADNDKDGIEGLIVIDENTFALDTYFSADGILDDIRMNVLQTATYIDDVMVSNLGGLGLPEICVTFHGIGGNFYETSTIRCFASDGNSYQDASLIYLESSATGSAASNSIMIDFDGDGNPYDICGLATFYTYGSGSTANISSSDTYVKCFDTDSGTLPGLGVEAVYNWNAVGTACENNKCFGEGGRISGADINNDGTEDIVGPAVLFFYNASMAGKISSITPTTNDTNEHAITGDLTSDENLEVVTMSAGMTVAMSSYFLNAPPVLNTTIPYGGYTGWYYGAPTCKGTTLDLRAAEIGANRNYDNDKLTDEERLATNCGQYASPTANLQYGAFSSQNPSFQCLMNTTGSFAMYIYLQDETNPSDLSQKNIQPIFVNVIDGVAGETCDIPESFITYVSQVVNITTFTETVAPDAPDTDEQIRSFWSEFNIGPATKIVIAFFIAIMMMFEAAALGLKSAAIQALVFIASMICTVMIGLINVWVVLIMLVSAALILFLTVVFGSGNNTGG